LQSASVADTDSGMSAIEEIRELLSLAHTGGRLFPATIFYNEGWLLRLVLKWFERRQSQDHPLSFDTGARWFSEALLPSQFFTAPRAEGWTHADGLIGHFTIGALAVADAQLIEPARQFVVTEAKLFSRLSTGVTNARYFDQAARNVACVAEVLSRQKRKAITFSSLRFIVIAPREQINFGYFGEALSKESIRQKVSRRVGEYSAPEGDGKRKWFDEWFSPTLEKIDINLLDWEAIVAFVQAKDESFGSKLAEFYDHCLQFNRIQEREAEQP
jgi:hypothetical protein